MEILPTETLAHVLTFLSPLDILNLPFNVSTRGLTTFEARHRFSEIRIWIGKTALSYLIRIANHPIISQCAERLTFKMPDNASLAYCTSKKWWTRELRATSRDRKRSKSRYDFSKPVGLEGDTYIRPLDVRKLRHIVRRFRGLRSVKIDSSVVMVCISLNEGLINFRNPRQELLLGNCCDSRSQHDATGWTSTYGLESYKPSPDVVDDFGDLMTWTILLGLAAADT